MKHKVIGLFAVYALYSALGLFGVYLRASDSPSQPAPPKSPADTPSQPAVAPAPVGQFQGSFGQPGQFGGRQFGGNFGKGGGFGGGGFQGGGFGGSGFQGGGFGGQFGGQLDLNGKKVTGIEDGPTTVLAAANPVPTPATKDGFVNPKVEPGKVKWHADFDAACKAAAKSGKPVLLFQMMGKLDDQFC